MSPVKVLTPRLRTAGLEPGDSLDLKCCSYTMPSWGHEEEHQSPGAQYKLVGDILESTSPSHLWMISKKKRHAPEKNGDLLVIELTGQKGKYEAGSMRCCIYIEKALCTTPK